VSGDSYRCPQHIRFSAVEAKKIAGSVRKDFPDDVLVLQLRYRLDETCKQVVFYRPTEGSYWPAS
jgi:putative lipoic acid-binding regulatory protein